MNRLGCVHLVGAGPGDVELLTLKARRLIAATEVVVFDRMVDTAVLNLILPGTERYDVGKASGRHAWPQERINALLVDLAHCGRDVVRLKGGDPFIFGRGGEESLHLARHGIPFDVVPGVTAASACAAAFGIPLTHRGVADGLHLVSGHRHDDLPLGLDWQRLADPRSTLAIYMGVATAGTLAEHLLTAGRDGATPVAVIEGATTKHQRLRRTTLAQLGADMAAWAPCPPALLLIGAVVDLAPRLATAQLEAAQAALPLEEMTG